MNKIDNIHLRRQLLDWRDKHIEEVHHHLSREIFLLFNELDQKIRTMTITDTFKSDIYTKKHIQPIYARWIESELSLLNNAAQTDLNKIHQHILDYQQSEHNLKHQNDKGSIVDAKVVAFSVGTAAAVIPTLISLSTTTVSAGGFLGLLGVTTTVISWPVTLVSITAVSGLIIVSGNKAINIKSKAVMRYKNKIQTSIQDRVIYNKANDSICQCFQAKIEEITNLLLSELSA